MHGFGLADALREHGDDLDAFAREFAAFTERELVPWFRSAVLQDAQAREAPAEPAAESRRAAKTRASSCSEIFREGLLPAMRTSPIVFRAFLRWFNLLATPDALMADSEIVRGVLAAYRTATTARAAPVLGPDRAEFGPPSPPLELGQVVWRVSRRGGRGGRV